MAMSPVVYLILTQVVAKAFTFGLNQFLLRRISPSIFGIAVFLEFLVSTVLFFSREAQRVAVQRAQTATALQTRQAIANFAYLPIILNIPVLLLVYYVQSSFDLYQVVKQLPHAHWTYVFLLCSVWIELLAEPLFALNQHAVNFKLRSKIESFAVLSKCVVTFAGIALSERLPARDFDGNAVLSFATGQFAYSASTFLGYLILAKGRLPKISKLADSRYFDPAVWNIWRSLLAQMVFKHLLTEGDSLLIKYVFSVSEQGVYSVIANYGSMVARLLFQPIEELVRVTVSKHISERKSPEASFNLVSRLLKMYLNLSVLIVVGGYTNGPFLLRLVLGRSVKWASSNVFEEFPKYVLYIPFLAFNGILEAFFSSASTQAQINKFSLFMGFLSVAVLALLHYLIAKLNLGISGLIIANVVNMTLRITYCSGFLISYFGAGRRAFFKAAKACLLPCSVFAGAMTLQFVLFENGFTQTYIDFLRSLVICVGCIVGLMINERNEVKALLSRTGRGQEAKKEI